MATRTNLKNSEKSFSMLAIAIAIAGASAITPQIVRADLTWDSSGITPSAPVDGSGNWDTTPLWSNAAGDIAWPNDTTTAVFGNGGAAGTVTLNTPITVGGLTFNAVASGNYLIAAALPADTLTLSGATPTVNVNAGATPTISAIVAGTSGLNYTGTGMLILSGPNTYSGTTTINSGQLQITNAAGFGTSTVNIISGGTANANNTGNVTNAFNIAGNGSGAQLGALINQNHSETYNGLITLTANARIGNGGFTSTFTGGITGNANLEFFGNSSGTATFKFNNNVAPAGVYNWTGNTTITAAGSGNTLLQFGASTIFPATSVVTLNATSTGLAEIDMTGRSETIAGLNSSGNAANDRIFDNATGNSTLTITNTAASSFAGTISSGPSTGTLSLTKTGTGMQTLSSANTYAGNTTISGGTLSVTSSLLSTGNVVLNAATLAGTGSVGLLKFNNAAAIINPGATGAGSVGTLTAASLTTTQTGTMQFDLFNGSLPATNDAVVVNSAVTFTAATAIAPSAGAQAGTYTILTAPSITYTATPLLTTPTGIRSGTTYTLVNNPTNMQVVVAGGPVNITWAGSVAGFTANSADGATWDNLIGTGPGVSNDQNWSNASTQDFYYEGDNVTFDETGSPNHNVNLTTNVSPGSVTFTNAATYTISGTGAIVGSTSLALNGTGTVILTTANTYSGGTTIGAGATLQVGDGSNTSAAIGTGPLSIAGSLIFDYSGNPSATSYTVIGAGSISLPTNGTKTFSLHWTGNNSGFNGNVSIGNGNRLEVSGASANLGPAASITVQNGGAFYSNGAGNFAGSLAIAGSGWSADPTAGTFGALRIDSSPTTFSGPILLTGNAEIYVTGAAATISGNITDANNGFTLAKAGSNFLIVSGNNTYTGGTDIAGGTLQLASATALPGTGIVTLGSAIALGSSAANANGTLDLNGLNAIVGGLATSGTSTSNTIGSSSTTSPSTLTFAGGTSSFSGKIVDALQTGNQTTALSVSSGALTLTSVNTYTGNTSVNAAATLTIALGGDISAATPLVVNGTLNFANATQTIASLNSSTGGTVNLNTTALTVTGGGTFVGTVQDGGTNGRLIIPVAATFTSGPVNVTTLEVDGKHILASTSPSKIGSLALAGTYGGSASDTTSVWTGSLDLTISKLIVEDSSGTRAADLAQIKNEALTVNTAGGTVGIYSSTANAANMAAGKVVKVVAVSDNAVRMATFPAGSTNFGGVNNVDVSSILVAAVFKGDANMDGVVDIQDLTDVANHWQQSVTDWSQGDFDGSNFVDIQDLTAVANNWQAGVGAGGGSSFSDALAQIGGFKPAATPEPASLAVLGLGGLVLSSRRRRQA